MVITNRYGHKAGNNKHWQIAMDHYSRFLWAVAVKVKSSIPKYMKRMEIQMEIDGRHSVHATLLDAEGADATDTLASRKGQRASSSWTRKQHSPMENCDPEFS